MTFETDNKMTFEPDNDFESGVVIRVIGVGGGGNNAVNRMIKSNVRGVDFVAVNTDRQALRRSEAPTQIILGEKITKGFGAGANPEVGARAAEESIEEIKKAVSGADMVFVTAGMGGGTGTGAAPIVARVAQDMGILTVGIVTKPFAFERPRRMEQAERGIKELRKYVDSLIVIPNEKLKEVDRVTLGNAFEIADSALSIGVQSISELINVPGFINVDFADVTTVMKGAGYAHMGRGEADGSEKATRAANLAINSPLLETSINGARGILVSITASSDMSLEEIDVASSLISSKAHPDANVIVGLTFDESMNDTMRVVIIATGFEEQNTEADVAELPVEPVVESPVVKVAAPVAPAVPVVPVAPAAPVAEEAICAEEATVAASASAPVAPVVPPVAEVPVIDEDDFDTLISMLKKKANPQ